MTEYDPCEYQAIEEVKNRPGKPHITCRAGSCSDGGRRCRFRNDFDECEFQIKERFGYDGAMVWGCKLDHCPFKGIRRCKYIWLNQPMQFVVKNRDGKITHRW